MENQELNTHKEAILKEIGTDWVAKEKSILISYGITNMGMPQDAAEDLAEFTIEDMLINAAKRKSKGLSWKMMFQPTI